jgi:Flp pilus assembly protein TadG
MQMTVAAKIKNSLKRFASDTGGNFSIMLALASVPMLLGVGAAIDFARFNSTQTHVQMALDAATLAAGSGKNLKESERIEAAKLVFDANIEKGAAAGYKIDVKFEVIDEKVISSAKVEMPTSFMAVGGFDKLVGNSEAEVNILADKKAEIALVLDFSWSMTESVGGRVKYKAMQEAAQKLIGDLAKSDPHCLDSLFLVAVALAGPVAHKTANTLTTERTPHQTEAMQANGTNPTRTRHRQRKTSTT